MIDALDAARYRVLRNFSLQRVNGPFATMGELCCGAVPALEGPALDTACDAVLAGRDAEWPVHTIVA